MEQIPRKRVLEREAKEVLTLVPRNIIRTETTLSKLPIHNLSKRGRIDISIIRKNKHDEIELRWEVSYNERYGQPRQIAYRLDTIIINRRIDEYGRPLPKVIRLGSLNQLCKELDLPPSGKNIQNLKNAFLQNASSFITAKLTYRAKDGTERQLEAGFTRYSVIFTGETLPDCTTADAVHVVFNDPYLEVLNYTPFRPLDYDYLKELTPAAQRFYEIVSYRVFWAIRKNYLLAMMRYSEYCLYAAQRRYYDYDHVKKQMYKLHRSHLASGYLKHVSYEATTDNEGKSDWVIGYAPGPKAKAAYHAFNKKELIEGEVPQDEEAHQGQPALLKEVDPSPAIALVNDFYRLFHGREQPAPSTLDIKRASELIRKYGIELARYIVQFSHREAPKTHYQPKMFGGILNYAGQAVADYRAHQARQAEQAAIDQCDFCNADGWISFTDATGSPFSRKCPHDLHEIEAYEQHEHVTRA
jgi:hypothetical protein